MSLNLFMFLCFTLTDKNLEGSKEKLVLRKSVIVVRKTK